MCAPRRKFAVMNRLSVCPVDFEKMEGRMSADNLNWGLTSHFLELVKRKTVLFLETGKIKGHLGKPRILIFQSGMAYPYPSDFSKGSS